MVPVKFDFFNLLKADPTPEKKVFVTFADEVLK